MDLNEIVNKIKSKKKVILVIGLIIVTLFSITTFSRNCSCNRTTTTTNGVIQGLIGRDGNNNVTSDDIDSLDNGTYPVK